jgi:hypothetical protein
MMEGAMDYLKANTEAWQAKRKDQQILARRAWAAEEPTWGIFRVPETVVGLLPSDLSGLDAVELGCGTA